MIGSPYAFDYSGVGKNSKALFIYTSEAEIRHITEQLHSNTFSLIGRLSRIKLRIEAQKEHRSRKIQYNWKTWQSAHICTVDLQSLINFIFQLDTTAEAVSVIWTLPVWCVPHAAIGSLDAERKVLFVCASGDSFSVCSRYVSVRGWLDLMTWVESSSLLFKLDRMTQEQQLLQKLGSLQELCECTDWPKHGRLLDMWEHNMMLRWWSCKQDRLSLFRLL